jgi:hypothetical protein
MDESKKKTKVKYCAECAVIRYIFSVIYRKIVFVKGLDHAFGFS